MAEVTQVRISELPAASEINDDDLLEIAQRGASRRVSVTQFRGTVLDDADQYLTFMPRAGNTVTSATKANPCVLTVVAPVDTYRLVPGASVYVAGSGLTALDGKWHKITGVAGTAVTIATSALGDPGTFAGFTLAVRDTPTPQ